MWWRDASADHYARPTPRATREHGRSNLACAFLQLAPAKHHKPERVHRWKLITPLVQYSKLNLRIGPTEKPQRLTA